MTQPVPWNPALQNASLELLAQIQQTSVFIGSKPTSISIERATVNRSAAGGRVRGTKQTLLPQIVRLIPQNTNNARGQEGREPRIDYILLAMPDANIERGDRFQIYGQPLSAPWYMITQKNDSFEYELRFEVQYAQ